MTLFLKCDSYKYFQSVVCVLHENLVATVSGWGVMVLNSAFPTPLQVWKGTPPHVSAPDFHLFEFGPPQRVKVRL